jgi:hypothetical protein
VGSKRVAQTKKLALIAALLWAASPAAAQVTTMGQQQSGQSSQSAPTQAPTTGAFCIEEMTATFCNVPTGPNASGYGSSRVSTSGSASSAVAPSSRRSWRHQLVHSAMRERTAVR